MSTFINTYRGMKIVIRQSGPDRVDYHVEKADGTIVEDTYGFDVTVEMATEVCKETIDDILDNQEKLKKLPSQAVEVVV